MIIGSVLEHLSDQVSALASVARLTKSTMVIVTALLETEEPVARFLPLPDYPQHDYTWWMYSIGTYRTIFKMLGFEIDAIKKNRYQFHLAGGEHERHTSSPRAGRQGGGHGPLADARGLTEPRASRPLMVTGGGVSSQTRRTGPLPRYFFMGMSASVGSCAATPIFPWRNPELAG